MTFSLVGRCGRTGMLGAIVASSSPAVGARCAWARAGVGAVCTQNVTDPTLGRTLLDQIFASGSAEKAMAAVTAEAQDIGFRQLTAIDWHGDTAVFSGDQTLGLHAALAARGAAAAGNLLADEGIPAMMTEEFARRQDQHIGDRLVAALRAGRDAGGEAGPVHSASVLIADTVPWPVTDLRVDWTSGDPIEELAALWQRWKPLADQYVIRALYPTRAPAYGVPGEAQRGRLASPDLGPDVSIRGS